ncbi:hypothetical protein [Trichloromonas sp.]|uniref:hypothetical protein n=1 Tax=Trichloromonas sp. TaxID=3069249 RepID=UPI003D8171C9
MKNIMKKLLFVAAALSLTAGAAFAADVDCTGAFKGAKDGDVTIEDGTGGGGTIRVTLSPNVMMAYVASTDGTTYAALSYNAKGTKAYGVASDYQGIKYSDAEAAILAENVTVPTVPSDGAFDSSWKEVGK